MSHAVMLSSDGSPPGRVDDPGALGATVPPTPEVAMLAATALGFAVNSGPTEANVRRLTALAGSRPDALVEACAAALQLGVTPHQDRVIAVELLGRAARHCAEPEPALGPGTGHGAGWAQRGLG